MWQAAAAKHNQLKVSESSDEEPGGIVAMLLATPTYSSFG
jgi:hypothetical protein